MKITNLRLRQLEGEMAHPEPFWEERLVRPIDIYPEYKAGGLSSVPERVGPNRYRMRSVFLEIQTDEGVTGISGPVSPSEAYIIDTQLRPILVGKDPLAIELLWDQMYRLSIHGRKGNPMMAISAVDCGLWDLKGRYHGVPVYRLLGGPTRESIPAYASMLGFSLEPAKVKERCKWLLEQGYKHTKWFFRYGPTDGREGIAKNVELARTLRESLGEDVDIMLDCWSSWDVPYTIMMSERLVEYNPRWLEEPVLADKIESYARIRAASLVPISGGEHEYTRWGFKAFMDAGAADILQPDIYWCGGISETLKICTLASVYDLPVIPHGHSVPATVHLLASQPPTLCPLLEYLVKWNQIHQFFLKYPIVPQKGVVGLPTQPGLGLDIDESKVKAEKDLTWRDS